MERNRILGISLLIACLFLSLSCNDDESEENELTGRSTTYPMVSGSEYDISGEIIFEEKKDGKVRISIAITPTGEATMHPVHVHYGAYTEEAEMAAMLMPVSGETGISITELDGLANGSTFTFDDLEDFDGHIKIHGDDGPNKELILAYANIGKNAAQ